MRRLKFIPILLLMTYACKVNTPSTEMVMPTPSSFPDYYTTALPAQIKTSSPEPDRAMSEPTPIRVQINLVNSGQQLGFAHSWDVALGDVDSDGDLDAFVANSIQGSVGSMVWLNDGSGLFTAIEQDLGFGQGISLADLDSDGDLDAVITNWLGNGTTSVWLNDGSGFFVSTGQNLWSAFQPALGDLDGDGDIDIFLGRMGANSVWMNDGMGAFTDTEQRLGAAITAAVGLADLDADGDLDALTAGWEEPAKVWLNDGLGNFTEHPDSLSAATVHVHGLALGDVDGDNDVDVFLGVASADPNQVWLNDGSASFLNSQQPLHSSLCHGVAFGDIDGDGDLDVVTAHGDQSGGSGGRIWINDGRGQFIESDPALGDLYSTSVAMGDLDRDGDLDIFLTHGETWRESGGEIPNEVWINETIIK